MKKLLSALVAILLLAGCSSNTPSGTTQDSNTCNSLNVFNVGEYIADGVNAQFEKEYGVKVNYSLFASNEEMYTKLQGSNVYDVIIPSDYMIQKLIDENFLLPLDKSLLTNFNEIYSGVLNKSYDPENVYSVPYFWGNVGIVYDTTKVDQADVESQGWEVFRNPKYAGMIYMYDSARDAFMVALKALGYSMNTTNEDELNEAFAWLSELGQTMEPYYATDEAIDGLIYGEKAMGLMYSGDAAYILSENEDMAYYVPEQGTNLWVDAMVIPSNAKCPELAHKYIDFMSSYDIALENSEAVGYSSANTTVYEELSSEGGDYYGINAYTPRVDFPADEVFVNNESVRQLITDLWMRVIGQ